jgi:hypothetical protein
MKLAIIILATWILVLELLVQNVERKSKADEEARRQELLRKAREREEWAKRYRR